MSASPDERSGASPWRTGITSRSSSRSSADVPVPGRRSEALAGTPDTADDLAVAGAVLDGDRDAFRILVERQSSAVVRACLRVLGDRHEAEDVAQEAFVIAYRSLATWRGDGPFGAWLTRIAVRLAVRQASRRRAVTWTMPIEDEASYTPPFGPTHAPEPEREALRAERASATRRAVATLEEPYREVIALRFFGDLTLDEISILTGRPLGTVKTHLRRGLLRLRDRLPGMAT
jgi:RNA polymerase sigma-70 factor, ECF subfamily